MAKFSGPSRHPSAIFTSRILQWVFGIHERIATRLGIDGELSRLGVAVVRRGSRPKTIRKISGWLKLGTTFLRRRRSMRTGCCSRRKQRSLALSGHPVRPSNVRSWVKRT